ncbi:MAG: hypothetical protein QM690_06920 [Sphingobium sp.]
MQKTPDHSHHSPARKRRHARLIADWRSAWRFWSVRLAALGAALMAGWTSLPPEVRAGMPYANEVAALLFAAVAAARLVAQEGGRA